MSSARAFIAGVLLCLLVGGCGGEGDSALGSSQSPDPVVVDFPIAYVKRPVFDTEGELPPSEPTRAERFNAGAELWLKDWAAPSAPERLLTGMLFPPDDAGEPARYDVKNVSASFDGERLLFALRAPEIPGAAPEDQPTWNVWIYDVSSDQLTRVIESDLIAEDGNDVAPRFLPDGRIVFASTRQRTAKAILLDENKPQFAALNENRVRPAFALHVMNDDGSDIQQITFNQSSDLDPAILSDGRVVFSRWDNASGRDRLSLYAVNPDGSNLQLLYGYHSHDTGPMASRVEFMKARELPDGRILAQLTPPAPSTRGSVYPVAIDVAAYIDHDVPTAANAGLLADAQETLFAGDLRLADDVIPLQGRYTFVEPLFDGTERLLVAWSQCRLSDLNAAVEEPVIRPCQEPELSDPGFVEAEPLYGVWIHDLADETQQPIVPADAGELYSEVTVLEPRTLPPVILEATPGIDVDADLVAQAVGVLDIRSVYDFGGVASADIATLADPALSSAADRPARFVRIVKAVSIPDPDVLDFDNAAFGPVGAMREIAGYAPVEPDGSVSVRVPANVALWLDVLDADGRRIAPRHNNWMHVRPGEVKSCNGCHVEDDETPHGRADAEPASAHPGAALAGAFANAVPEILADVGETMAQARSRQLGPRLPSFDLTYVDDWTDPAVRSPDETTVVSYRDLSTPAPVAASCVSEWTSICRAVVHYPDHIHPLWSVDRQVFANDGVTLLEDRTCTTCHNRVDQAGLTRIPAGQLDLSDGVSAEEALHEQAYRELVFEDNEQTIVDAALQDVLVPVGVDANGDPIFETVSIGAPLVPTSATASTRFFSRFAAGGTHARWLTDAELRLVSEWIDLGGQYYNNPFDVPQ